MEFFIKTISWILMWVFQNSIRYRIYWFCDSHWIWLENREDGVINHCDASYDARAMTFSWPFYSRYGASLWPFLDLNSNINAMNSKFKYYWITFKWNQIQIKSNDSVLSIFSTDEKKKCMQMSKRKV